MMLFRRELSRRDSLTSPFSSWLRCVLTAVLAVGVSQGAHLFRSSPGGAGPHAAGLWGGDINITDDGASSNLYEVGFDRITTNNTTRVGLDIVSLSYDPLSHGVVVEIRHDAQTSTIARGSLCQPAAGLTAVADGVRLSSAEHPYLVDEYCEWKCGWNAFAFLDGRLYFLLSAVFGQHISRLTREIQLRVLTAACPTPATTGSTYDILRCSEEVAVLHSERYLYPTPTLDVWAAGAMTAISEGPENPLRLFVQLFNKTTSGVFMNLVQISLDNGQASILPLHGTLLDNIVYHGNWRVRGLGEMAYRDGLLCWTAAEELYCGHLEETGLTEVTRMLQSGEAYGNGICTGSLAPYPIGRVLTGVSIASAQDPVAIYFGCYSEKAGVGGLGLLQLSALYTGLQRHLAAVHSGDQRVLGGALFLIEDLQAQCQSSTPPTTATPVTPSCPCGSKSPASTLESRPHTVHMHVYTGLVVLIMYEILS